MAAFRHPAGIPNHGGILNERQPAACADSILPCPFCGSASTCLKPNDAGFAVACEACGGIGPGDDVEDFAVRRWNSRSALAATFRAPTR